MVHRGNSNPYSHRAETDAPLRAPPHMPMPQDPGAVQHDGQPIAPDACDPPPVARPGQMSRSYSDILIAHSTLPGQATQANVLNCWTSPMLPASFYLCFESTYLTSVTRQAFDVSTSKLVCSISHRSFDKHGHHSKSVSSTIRPIIFKLH